MTPGQITMEAWRPHCIHHCFGCMAGSTGPPAPFERATWIAPLSERPFSYFHSPRLVSQPVQQLHTIMLVVYLLTSLLAGVVSAGKAADLVGTWTTKSRKVVTGPVCFGQLPVPYRRC